MSQTQFVQQLRAYDRWKTKLILTLEELQPWLERQGMSSADSDRRIARTLATLRSDRLTIAFVAEFSRGKTELINALFFSDYGRRLLPSTAGRTTMCPTELFYDKEAEDAYIRLLPIETRAQEIPISELRNDPSHWVHYPLDVGSAQQMEHALKEVIRTKRVNLDQAKSLNLQQQANHLATTDLSSEIDIPKWRHALISFPHPLLKQGLTILDTPGLNALGSEPELTLNLLPNAQAVLFVLTADAGVTRSDLEVWREHIRSVRGSGDSGLMVALNKIDLLWDDLLKASAVEMAVQQQRHSTADILGINSDAIFPVSAQKGLLAKIRNDPQLLEKSALPDLEAYLSQDILGNKQQIVQDMVSSDVGHMMENIRRILENKSLHQQRHLDELNQLTSKSREAINRILQRTRDEQSKYLHDVEVYKVSRGKLAEAAETLRAGLDMTRFDQWVKTRHQQMKRCWTTRGMRKGMKQLFDSLTEEFQGVVEQSERTENLLAEIYDRFHVQHGFSVVCPPMYPIMKYQVDLDLLTQEAEAFRNSRDSSLTEQAAVIRRFFHYLVSRARNIFSQTSQEAENWLHSAFTPLTLQIREHKEMLEKRVHNLQRLGRSKKGLELRIQTFRETHESTTQQLSMVREIHDSLTAPSLNTCQPDLEPPLEEREAC